MSSDPDNNPTAEEVLIYTDKRSEPPTLRFLHYNDVYHVAPGSREPVGGTARFQTLCNYYRNDKSFEGQPSPLTFFSGDAFNPSLESSVTKGKHMTPILNALKTDVACVGNHDLDFGVPQFRYLAGRCEFPWLLANVLDPALGEDVPLGNAKKTVILTSSNGIKVGVIGLAEREWLDTINSLPPDLIYKSASATAKELCPKLREEGAEIIVAVTHQREPNDNKLAEKTDGLIDIVLGGHDHFYAHSLINGTHVLRSGTDFKQLSHIKLWRRSDGTSKWDLEIVRRDIVSEIAEDPDTAALVEKLTSSLKAKLERPVGYILAPLDGRFTTVRLKESNLGNFVCDLMRLYYQADCTIMAAGTIRGDQIYPPGVLRLKDIMNCFPFEDPVVVIQVPGSAIEEALENAVSSYPALEGRFPQLSNIRLRFDPEAPPNARLIDVRIGDAPLDPKRQYKLATRGYMARGKDGYDSLLVANEGGTAVELVSEENGVLISMILRQYFMSLKVLGRWRHWGTSLSRHWAGVHSDLHGVHPVRESQPPSPEEVLHRKRSASMMNGSAAGPDPSGHAGADSDSEDELHPSMHETHGTKIPGTSRGEPTERELAIMRKVLRKWWRVAGLPGHPSVGHEEEGEFNVVWTKGIAPRTEGRIEEVRGGKSKK